VAESHRPRATGIVEKARIETWKKAAWGKGNKTDRGGGEREKDNSATKKRIVPVISGEKLKGGQH